MCESVVADQVPGGMDAAGEFAALANEAPDKEEGRGYVVAGENFKDLLGAGVIGTVIIGEGILIGIEAREDGLAKDLRGRPHGGVGVSAAGEANCREGCNEGGEHRRI